MTYLLVQYWPFLAASAAAGVVVGWWAQGSRRRGWTDPSQRRNGEGARS